METLMKTLLIVDSSVIIRDRLLEALKEHQTVGNILIATDFDHAVKILEKTPAHYALLDIQLIGKNGLDLLKFFSQTYPTMKVIMFTNLADDNYEKVARQFGAIHFLDKSRDFDEIPELLAAL